MRKLILILVTLILLLGGCVSSGPKQAYPPDERLRLAAAQRQAFVKAFLQGRWCEAESMFYASNEKYLHQDDFCAVAYNYELFWKLKGYLGLDAPGYMEKAREFRELGLDCPEAAPAMPRGSAGGGGLPVHDRAYRVLLEERDFPGLYDRLSSEKNQLYASVYARKAALLAGESGEDRWAGRFAELARNLDAQRGWVVFLLEDWRLIEGLSRDAARKQAIRRRISRLQDLIRPCDR